VTPWQKTWFCGVITAPNKAQAATAIACFTCGSWKMGEPATGPRATAFKR
jgi:hypothetical protein